jgi:hypothetical protein
LEIAGVGAAVLQIKLDDAGKVLTRAVVAAVPPGSAFGPAVAQAAAQWTVRTTDAPAGCTPPGVHWVPVVFSLY